MSDLKKKYRVTYDSENGDIFKIHMEGKEILFKCNKDGLYEYQISDDYLIDIQKQRKQEARHLVETIKDNREGFTYHQFSSVRQARELYHNVCSPTVANFKALLKMKMIKNYPIRIKVIKNAERIFGPAKSTPKGKTTK